MFLKILAILLFVYFLWVSPIHFPFQHRIANEFTCILNRIEYLWVKTKIVVQIAVQTADFSSQKFAVLPGSSVRLRQNRPQIIWSLGIVTVWIYGSRCLILLWYMIKPTTLHIEDMPGSVLRDTEICVQGLGLNSDEVLLENNIATSVKQFRKQILTK